MKINQIARLATGHLYCIRSDVQSQAQGAIFLKMNIEQAKAHLTATLPKLDKSTQAAINTLINSLDSLNFKLATYEVEDLPGEEWRDVVGYEGFYKVSSFGRVKSLYTKRKRILKGDYDKNNYLRVCLTKGDGGKNYRVNRIVALAFIPNPENKPEVHHRDHNKLNNRVDNLEWTTSLENTAYSIQAGVRKNQSGTKNFNSKFSEDDIRWIRSHHQPGSLEYGTRALAKKFNVKVDTINAIVTYKSYKSVL